MKQGSDEWLAQRRRVVTSTDIPAILGISPWASEGDVARAKRGEEEPPDAGTARRFRLGHALEEVVRAEDEIEHGTKLRRVHRFITRGDIAGTSLDYERVGERTIVEIKTTGGRAFDDGLPEYVEAQVRWQMGVARYPRAHVAVLRSGSQLICYDVEHDEATFDGLKVIAADFWQRYLAGGPFAETRDSVRRAWPRDDGTELDAEPPVVEAVDDLVTTRGTIAQLKEHEDALVAAIQTRMGPATAINGPGWRVTWKQAKDTEVTDYKTQAHDALRALADHDPAAAEVLTTIHTNTRPGSRRFLVRMENER